MTNENNGSKDSHVKDSPAGRRGGEINVQAMIPPHLWRVPVSSELREHYTSCMNDRMHGVCSVHGCLLPSPKSNPVHHTTPSTETNLREGRRSNLKESEILRGAFVHLLEVLIRCNSS